MNGNSYKTPFAYVCFWLELTCTAVGFYFAWYAGLAVFVVTLVQAAQFTWINDRVKLGKPVGDRIYPFEMATITLRVVCILAGLHASMWACLAVVVSMVTQGAWTAYLVNFEEEEELW